eukprot:3576464-Amphidinium_carterae.1
MTGYGASVILACRGPLPILSSPARVTIMLCWPRQGASFASRSCTHCEVSRGHFAETWHIV